ncbi:MAG: beta-glucosidase, partial [Calditrichaeota bacterium]|nr:beta-glucosidase [Calditrichota bacterium]
ANDGSVLSIDGTVVVDNAGYSGKKVDNGKIHLDKGKHFIKVLYYENTGTESLDVSMEGPGFEKQEIPPNKLFLENN